MITGVFHCARRCNSGTLIHRWGERQSRLRSAVAVAASGVQPRRQPLEMVGQIVWDIAGRETLVTKRIDGTQETTQRVGESRSCGLDVVVPVTHAHPSLSSSCR